MTPGAGYGPEAPGTRADRHRGTGRYPHSSLQRRHAVRFAAPSSTHMSDNNIDEQLVARAQAGDERAFELLVRKYQYKIVQLVGRLVGEAEAADVAQETQHPRWGPGLKLKPLETLEAEIRVGVAGKPHPTAREVLGDALGD